MSVSSPSAAAPSPATARRRSRPSATVGKRWRADPCRTAAAAVARRATPSPSPGSAPRMTPFRASALPRAGAGLRAAGAAMSDAAELAAGERERVLAKSALFNPPPATLPDGRRESGRPVAGGAGGGDGGDGREALPRQAALALDLPPGRNGLRPDVHGSPGRCGRGSRSASSWSGRRSPPSRPAPTRRANGCSASATGSRWRRSTSPTARRIAARSASRTQVGCTLSCRFCHTGTQKLVRNLGAAEIVGQFMAARDSYGEWPSPKDDKPRLLSTIVVMGMGEPLYNYENTAKALRIIMDHEGIGLSRRRITLSHQRRGADDGPLRRGAGRQPRRLAARGDGRAAQRDRAAEPQIPDRRAAGRLPPLSRRVATRGGSPSSTSCCAA